MLNTISRIIKNSGVIFLIILIISVTEITAQNHPHLSPNTTYYISSSSGNDLSSGISPSHPWKTTANITYYGDDDVHLSGTKILFKRGDIWNDTGFIIKNLHGTHNNPLIIGAYGSGAKPIISGKSEITSTFYKLNYNSGNQI